MRKLHSGFLPLLFLSILLSTFPKTIKAEGTKQVAPTTADFVMLETNNPDFGDFASFDGPAESRLYISIEDASEMVYLGLSPEYNEDGNNVYQSQGKASYRMRIFRYNGPGDSTLVHGPFIIGGLSNPFNVINQAQAIAGPDVLNPGNGYATTNPVYTFQPTSPGDYFIQFEDVNTTDNGERLLIPFWDITVVQNGEEQIGRVWSQNWAFRTPPVTSGDLQECQWDRSFTGTLFSYTTDGFVSKIDFSESGFQGLSFNVAFNSRGPNNTGDASLDRQSVPGANVTGDAAEHKIFLNIPDEILFPSDESSCGTIVAASLFNCQDNGEFCLEVEVNKPGQMNIILDFDQDGEFTPSARDVNLVYTFTQEELAACIPWDGLRGDGSQSAFGDTVNIIFIFSQGVQNWAVYDAEYLRNGFCVEVVRPICQDGFQPNFLYWDDREIPLPSGTGQPNDGRGGCECENPDDNCRTWDNFNINADACENVVDELTTGYGDKNTINTWWFANIIKLDTINVPLLTCQIDGDSTLCEGDAAEFTAQVSSMTTMFTYSWEGPNGFTGSDASTGPITTPGEYCVTIVDERDCSTVCCKTLTQFDRPSLQVNGTNATCEGGAADGTITAQASGGSGGFMYQLDDGPFQASGIFTGISPGIYTVRVMDEAGCIAEAIQQIELELFGILNYVDSLFICYGDSIQIPSPGDINNLTFDWFPTTGLDDPTSPTPTFFPDTTTTYTVTVSLDGIDICHYTEEVIVEVAPNINLQVQTSDICTSPFILTATSDITDASFTWLDENDNIVSNNATLEIILSGMVTYTVIATDSFGCNVEEEITIGGGPIDIEPIPDAISICLGEEVNLDVINLDPNDNLTISWTPVDAFEPGTANTASPDYIETVGNQTVFVNIENQFGCILQDTVDITVIDSSLQLNFTPELQCDGLSIIFNNTSQNVSDFIWDFGDNSSSTETSPTHTYAQAGTYTVTLTTPFDVSCSDTVSMEVEVADTLVIAAFDYDLNCMANGSQIAFFDQSVVNVGNIASWNWTFSNGDSSNDQNPVIEVTESEPLIATLTVVLDNGCDASVSDTIDVQLIEVNIPDTLILCPNTSVFLNPGGNPGYIYHWSPATGLNSTSIANPEATPDTTTTYTVEVALIGSDTCTITDEVTVIVAEDFTFDIGDDQTTCGENVTLTANASVPVTVEWFSSELGSLGSSDQITINPVSVDTITAIATDQYGCSKTDTAIIIDQGVEIEVTPGFDINTCEPIETTISVTNLDGDDQLTYAWSPAENIISGANSSEVTVFVNEGSITFTGLITNQFGCDSTVTITIAIAPFEVNIPDTVYVCAGDAVNLAPGANPTYNYEWTPADDLDDPNSNNPLFTGTESASYLVTISDQFSGIQCDTTVSVDVIVLDSFNLEVTPGDTSLCSLAPITLIASSTRTDDFEINWYYNNDFDTSLGTGSMITVTPTEGQNIYTAVASDDFGCVDTSSVIIQATDFQPGLDSPIKVCPGVPTPINPDGNPNYEYTWEPTDGLDLSDPSNPIATIDVDHTFNVTVTDPGSGCEIETTIDVLVFANINLQVSDDVSICEADVITLTASTDVPGANIIWSLFPDFSVIFNNGETLTFSPTVGETTLYVSATDENGCNEMDSLVINVIDLPLDPLPDVLQACVNTPTPLNPGGDTGYNYNWSPSIGLDATDIANPIATVSEDITYMVTISDPSGLCEVVDTLNVVVFPDINLETTGDTTVCELTEELILTATTDVPATVEWLDENGVSLGTGNSLPFTPMEGTNIITAIATDANGCTDSSSVTIFYLPLDGGIPDSILMVCFEEPTPLNPNGDPNLVYNWAPPTGLSATDIANPIATLSESVTYTVTISDPNGICVVEDTLVVEVFPDINLETTGDTTVCELTEELILTATTDVPATVEWLDENGVSLGTGNSLPFTPMEGTNIVTAIATDANGCTDSSSVTIFYLPLDGGIPDSIIMVCFEEPTPLNPNGDPNLIYNWAPPTGLSATDIANPIATLSEGVTYSVTISDPNGICVVEDTLVVEVYPDINLETTGDTTVCELTEELILTAITDVPATVEWLDENGVSLGTGNNLPFMPMEGTNIVTAIATDANGCSDSSSVTIFYLPLDGGIPDSILMVCFEEPTPLNPNGDPNLVYNWAPPTGLSATDIANPIATLSEGGTYSVTISDPNGICVVEDTLVVEVYPDINLETTGDTTVCELTEELILTATTDVPATVEWLDQNGGSLGTGNNLPFMPMEGTNIVTAIATDANGCSDSSSVTIFYLPLDGGIPDSILMVCFEEPTPLNPNGDPNLVYNWAPPTGLSATDIANPIATLSESVTYSVTISDPNGICVVEDTLVVEVYPDINLETTGDTTVCELTEELILTATTDVSATVEWLDQNGGSLGTGNSLPFTPMEGTNIVTAIATDANGCTDSSSVTIFYLPLDGGIPDSILMVCFEAPTPLNPNGDPNLVYNWAPPTGLSATDIANPIATLTEGITYTVTISDPNGICVVEDTLVVEVYPDINLETTGDTTVCELTEELILTATTDVSATVEWLDENGVSLGTGNSLPFTPMEGTNIVTAIATDANGCTDSSSVTIFYLPLDGGIPDSILMVCFEEPTPLNPNGDPNLVYNWAPPTGLSATDIANPIATLSEGVTYTVTISDPNGICVVEDTLVVEVYPDINLQTTDDTLVCDVTEELILTATTNVPATIEWFDEDGNNLGIGETLPFMPMEGTNIVTVIATDANGCADSNTITIIYVPLDTGIPDSILLTCFEAPTPLNPNGDPNLVYNWAPPTGLSATDIANPIATLTEGITYTVTISDPNGICVVEDTLVVEVYPDINLETTGDTTVCELTEELILTATTDVSATVEWLDQNGVSLGTGNSLPFTPMEGTNIVTAIATDANGCTDSSSVTIFYLPLDGGIPDSILMVCFEEPTPLNPNGDPNLVYNWAPPTGLSATDIANPIATLSEGVTYSVTISDPNGICVVEDTLVVEVYPDINLETTGDTTVCELTEELILTATTDVSATVEWLDENGGSLGTGNSLPFTPMEGTNIITAIATDANGCTDSSSVTIFYLPLDGGIPDSILMVCFEEPTPLNPNGDPNLVYNWAPPTGLSATDIANPIATLTEGITYTVTISDPNGICVVEDTLVVEVYPDINLETTGDTTVCELTEELILTATTDVPATVEWLDENGVSLGTGNSLPFTPMEGTNIVTAIATDANGCTDSSSVTIFYLPLDGGIPDSILMVCFEEPTPLNPNGDPNLVYNWAPPTGLSATDIANPIATLSEGVTYSVTISDPNGICVVEDTLVVEVYPDINLQTTDDTLVCDVTEELILTATTNVPATIEWFDEDGNNLGIGETLPFMPMEGTNIVTVIATDANGCADSNTITIIYVPLDTGIPDSILLTCFEAPTPLNPNGDPNLVYNWAPPTGLSATNIANPIATLSENITYMVTISDPSGICVVVDTLVVEVYPDINLQTSGDTTLCELNGAVLLSASTDVPATIEWFDENGNSMGIGNTLPFTPSQEVNTITAIATDDNGCSDTSIVTIIYLPLDAGVPDSILMVCFEEPTPLNPNGNPNLVYNWAPPTGLSATDVVNPIATVSENITYTVTISDPNGVCVVEDTLLVEVYPDINLQTSGDTTICELDELTLTATTDLPATIDWFNENGELLGSGNIIQYTPVEGTNTITAVAMDDNGCTDSSTVTLIYLPFDGGIPDSILMICFEEPTPLNPNGDPNLVYSWAPPTGLNATDIANPIATVTGNITYTVTISDPNGICIIEDTLLVEVYPDINLETTGDTTICELSEVTLMASTNVPATIEWFNENEELLGSGNTLAYTPTEGSNTITAVATDDNGCTDSSAVIVIYLPMDGGIQDSVLLVCPGEPTPLNPTGDPGLTYKWQPETGLDDPTSYNPIATVTEDITYNVVISDSAETCLILDTLTVSVTPPIGLVTTGDTTICDASVITLMAATDVPATIEWFDGDGSLGTGNTLEYTLENIGNNEVLVIATDENGCMDSSTINIIYIPEDGIFDDPISTCANEPIPLNPGGSNALRYQWSPANVLDDPNAINPIAILTETTTFVVTITESTQTCEVVDTLVVEVFPDIGLETMGDTILCEIQEVELTATTTNSADIEWFDNTGSLGTGNTLFYTPPMVGSNTILAVATDANGCVDSSTVVITILPPDGGLADSLFVCPGTPTSLNPDASPGLIYSWSPAIGLDDPTIGNPTAILFDAVTYIVTITTPNMECEVVDTLVVDVYPPIGLETSNDTTLCSPDTILLFANTQVNAGIEWLDELGNTIGVGSPLEYFPTVEGITPIVALAVDENGCRDSSKLNITYEPLESGIPDSLTICFDQPTELNPDGDPSLSYQWSPGTGLDDPLSFNPIATITEATTYIVTITDFNSGCQNVDTLNVEVLPDTGLSTSGDTTVCDTSAIMLFASTEVDAFIFWSDLNTGESLGEGNSIMYSPQPGTNLIQVLAKDFNECPDTAIITIIIEELDTGLEPMVIVCADTPTPLNPNGNPNLDYQWDPSTGLDLSDPSNPIATIGTNQTYSVTVTNPLTTCEVVSEVEVQIAPSPAIVAAGDTTVCASSTVDLMVSGDSTDIIYNWYDHPDLMDVIATGEQVSVTPGSSTTYYVVGTNDAGCSSLDSVQVSIIGVNAMITPDAFLCAPVDSYELMVTNLDTTGVLTIEWFPDSAIITDPATGPIVTVDPNISNTFTAVVTNQFGCVDTLTTTVTVFDLEADLEISANPDTIIVGESSDVIVLGCDECTYDWIGPANTFDPSDGPSIIVSPTEPGTYLYEAIVTDSNNCVAMLTQEVVVIAEPLEICDPNNYFIPNLFTPNDDGMNDVFLLRSRLADLIQMELIVYNRWGEEVFRSKDINIGWDGTFKGDRLPPDVYGYYLKVICPGDDQVELQGNVTLMR